jgi:hypothetical protein
MVKDAVKTGQKSLDVYVRDAKQAEQVFNRTVASHAHTHPEDGEVYGYINTGHNTQLSQFEIDLHHELWGDAGTYHWDNRVAVNYDHRGVEYRWLYTHYEGQLHGQYRHLQIETWEGTTIRLMYGNILPPPPDSQIMRRFRSENTRFEE